MRSVAATGHSGRAAHSRISTGLNSAHRRTPILSCTIGRTERQPPHPMRRYERWLRLATGLLLACYVIPHFLNHSLGVVSVDAMDRLRTPLAAWWRSAPGTVVLYGALLTHFALALVALYRRTTLRMPKWEAAQLVLGLAVPPLLIAHIVGTRFTWLLTGQHIGYQRVVGLLWSEPLAA